MAARVVPVRRRRDPAGLSRAAAARRGAIVRPYFRAGRAGRRPVRCGTRAAGRTKGARERRPGPAWPPPSKNTRQEFFENPVVIIFK